MQKTIKFFRQLFRRKSQLKPMGVRSIYPLGYNKNNPFADQACEKWRLHIMVTLFLTRMKNALESIDPKIKVHVVDVNELEAKMNMESLVKQAQNILKGVEDE